MEVDSYLCRPIFFHETHSEMHDKNGQQSNIHSAFEFWRKKEDPISQPKKTWPMQKRSMSTSFSRKYLDFHREEMLQSQENRLMNKTQSVRSMDIRPQKFQDVGLERIIPSKEDAEILKSNSQKSKASANLEVTEVNFNSAFHVSMSTETGKENNVDSLRSIEGQGEESHPNLPLLDISKLKDSSVHNNIRNSPVEQKRQSYASHKNPFVSPLSPHNPISVVREGLLGKSFTQRNLIENLKPTSDNSTTSLSPRINGRSQSCMLIGKDDEGRNFLEKHKKTKSTSHKSSNSQVNVLHKSKSKPVISSNSDEEKSSERLTRDGELGIVKNRSPRKTSPQPSPKSKEPSPRTCKIFGQPLELLPSWDFIPCFIVDACTNLLLNKDYCDYDTLLQPSLTVKDLSLIKLSIEDSSLSIKEENDLVIVLNSLMMLFEELPVSILTQKHYTAFFGVLSIKDANVQLRYAHSIIYSLPLTQRKVLNFITNFLNNFVSSKSHLKKICFLLRSLIYKPKQYTVNDYLDIPRSSSDFGSKPKSPKIVPLDKVKQSSDSVLLEKSKKLKAQKAPEGSAKILYFITRNREVLFSLKSENKTFCLTDDHQIQMEACTEQAIFEMLADAYYCEKEFKDIFFATYPLFMSSEHVFDTLMEIYKSCERKKEWTLQRRTTILKLLIFWFKNYPKYSLSSQNFIDIVVHRRQKSITAEEDLLWAEVYKTLMGQLALSEQPTSPSSIFERKPSSTKIMSYDPTEIAKVITMVDFSYFKQIDIDEYLRVPISADKTPNIYKMMTQFNNLSLWVQDIIVSGSSIDERVSIIVFLSKVLNELIQLNNFNSALSIYTGLEASVLSTHISKTMAKSKKKIHKILEYCEKLFSMSKNYKVYCEKLRSNSTNRAIPIIVLISKNLTIIEELQELMVEGKINYDKLRAFYSALKDPLTFAKSNYNFNVTPSLVSYFESLEPRTEHEIEEQCKSLEEKGKQS